jgi:hypothetical protein
MRFWHSLAAACSLTAIGAATTGAAAPDFDRDIRPILSDKCFHCHGPDAETREADLRLDMRISAVESAIVPGQPDESELIARVTSDDESLRMPPPETQLSLTVEQKELLRRWIEAGAPYTEHWSFRPLPAMVELPQVRNEKWPRQPLDRFVLAKLEQEGLQPASSAAPLRLLRRLSLDLTGLPPTVEQIAAFESAAAKDLDGALAQAAERLLASPAHGEHMAVAWLDAARYADSFGYQSDQLNTQWPYRDWVVRAFNQNLPYDEFLTWQLAGDLLGNATRDQILATAFNRMHRMTNEGGSIAEEWLAENAADRVQTMGAVMLGLTLECARCHDHKYDPISSRDYYSLAAFFNSIDENGLYDHTQKVPSPTLLLPTGDQEKELAASIVAREQAAEALSAAIERGNARFDQWLHSAATTEPSSVFTNADLAGFFTFDGDLTSIANEAPGRTKVGAGPDLASINGVRGRAVRFDGDHGVSFPELMKVDRWDSFALDFWLRDNARSPRPVVVLQRTHGTDVGYNGFDVMIENGVLSARFYRVWPGNGIGVRAETPLPAGEWRHVAVTYDGSSRAAGLRLYVDGREIETTVLRDRVHKSASIGTFGAGHFTLGERFRDRGFTGGEIDELRVFVRGITPLEIAQLHDEDAMAAALAEAPSNVDLLREYYFSAVDAEARQAAGALREARQRVVAVEEAIHEVSVVEELSEPRPTYILARGAYDAPRSDANRVERDVFKSMLPPFPNNAPRNRLGLARWLTATDHPLTARVFVNRMWASFFGYGLVRTPENFGRQGEAPTHPELLDWLARDFVDHGWDMKRLCRQIVLSATYQQNSRVTAERRQRDPENRLLARGPSRRLSAEQLRDLALAASDSLVATVGGPPVYPYQAGGDLWKESNSMSPSYVQSTGDALRRRSLYSVWKRTAPLPNMTVFDATTREVCTISRGRTNTPLQALVLLNDVQFIEPMRALAALASRNVETTREQIDVAFLRLTGRRIEADELELLLDAYHVALDQFKSGEQDAATYLDVDDVATDELQELAKLAALTVVCQSIFNLDATVMER